MGTEYTYTTSGFNPFRTIDFIADGDATIHGDLTVDGNINGSGGGSGGDSYWEKSSFDNTVIKPLFEMKGIYTNYLYLNVNSTSNKFAIQGIITNVNNIMIDPSIYLATNAVMMDYVKNNVGGGCEYYTTVPLSTLQIGFNLRKKTINLNNNYAGYYSSLPAIVFKEGGAFLLTSSESVNLHVFGEEFNQTLIIDGTATMTNFTFPDQDITISSFTGDVMNDLTFKNIAIDGAGVDCQWLYNNNLKLSG
jgi:hypothetical protein